MTKRLTARLALFLLLLGLLFSVSSAAASAAPVWRIDSLATTTVDPTTPTPTIPGTTTSTIPGCPPGKTCLHYIVHLTNVGDAPIVASPEHPWRFTVSMPPGLSVLNVTDLLEYGWDCSEFKPGAPTFSCVHTHASLPKLSSASFDPFLVNAEVTATSGALTSRFSISGGGASPASTARTTVVTPDLPGFGIEAFDERAFDAEGAPFTQAGGHPSAITTSIDFNTIANSHPLKNPPWPAEPVKDVDVDLPPGALGNPAGVPQCSLQQLTSDAAIVKTECPVEAQVGTTVVRANLQEVGAMLGPVPVYNMVPPPDAPARLGFNVYGTIVTIDAKLRSASDFGLTAEAHDISQGLSFVGTELTLWGVPAAASHDFERTCFGRGAPWQDGPSCPSGASLKPFWRNPTSCAAEATGLPTTVHADSWFHPGDFDQRTIHSHLPPGYALPESEWGAPQGPTGCSKVRFEPSIEAAPTTNTADSPSGLDFHLSVPKDCWNQTEGLCQSDMRGAEVTLPKGMSLNPSAASGIGSCTPGQIGLTTPVGSPSSIHFNEARASCPDSSKIGTVQITSPLLSRHDPETGEPFTDSDGNLVPEPLTGTVYLAQQSKNPFGSLLAMYLVAEGSGVIVKQAGEIEIGPGGRMTTVFTNAPQQPFSDLEVKLFGGPRAPLRTPPSCGSYAINATLTPWSGNASVNRSSGFEITNCPISGFDPKLFTGTQNPLAGATSDWNLRLTRQDAEQELSSLNLYEPSGLSGYLNGIPYCPDATIAAVSGELGTGASQEQHPSCPAASRVGTVTVGAGAGPLPFYTSSGRVYLTGPYKGAPLSATAITPAVAGPFDLGSVVVKNAVHIDPTTAQLTIASDPFPTALHGIPLDLRDIRVDLDRDHFILNPTSCDPMQFTSRIASTQGASAAPSVRFQVAGCERLGFKPKLSLKLKGKSGRGANPALTAVMRPRAGDANLSRIQVALPHSEFLDQAHIRTICTRIQFAADQCPPGSIYGHVTATSPALDYPLSGNAYLRSSSNELPDLVLALRGPASQPIEIDAVGRIDSIKGGIRTTFETVPDAPLSKVVLRMQGGKKGLLQNSRNICTGTFRAEAELDAHNGRVLDLAPVLKASCSGKEARARHRSRP